MRAKHQALVLIAVSCVPGCFSFSLGTGGQPRPAPTLAQEITELGKLRQRGTISAREFEMGKLTLLQQYRREAPGTPDYAGDSGPQLATYPSEVDQPAITK